MKKIIYFFPIIAIILIALPASYVLAVELTYPNLGVTITPGTDIVGYIRYYFVFGVLAAGILGVGSIAISGLQILFFAGSPSKIGPAKERIMSAILGIILLFCSIILLQTINPSLVTQVNFVQPPGGGGAFLVRPNPPPLPFNDFQKNKLADIFISSASAQNDPGPFQFPLPDQDQDQQDVLTMIPAPENNDDLTDEINSGFILLVHYCEPGSEADYLVSTYVSDEYEVSSQATTISLPCSTSLTQGITLTGKGSYQLRLKNGGIYYYSTPDCTGLTTFYDYDERFSAQTQDDEIPYFQDPEDPGISQTLDQTVRSIGFLPGSLNGVYPYVEDDFYWGVILNQGKGSTGECSAPIVNYSSGFLCVRIGDPAWPQTFTLDNEPFNPISVHVIHTDKNPNYDTNKGGVTFWSFNKQFTLDQADNTETDINRNIEAMWHYDKNSLPQGTLIDVSSQGDGSLLRAPKGNIDELLRMFGKRSNNNFGPVPGDECIPFDPEDPANRDSTLGRPASPPPTGSRTDKVPAKGYLQCINQITMANSNEYEIVLYTINIDTNQRGCFIVGGDGGEFYNDRVWPPASGIPTQLNKEQTVYQTYIYPNFNSSLIYRP